MEKALGVYGYWRLNLDTIIRSSQGYSKKLALSLTWQGQEKDTKEYKYWAGYSRHSPVSRSRPLTVLRHHNPSAMARAPLIGRSAFSHQHWWQIRCLLVPHLKDQVFKWRWNTRTDGFILPLVMMVLLETMRSASIILFPWNVVEKVHT